MGVDVATYDMLMDLQHRDITPEDYDTLRTLDLSVKPKTLSIDELEAHAPRWVVLPQVSPPEGDLPRPTDETCSICLEKVGEGESVRRLRCKHLFHTQCIDAWLTESSDACPDCAHAHSRTRAVVRGYWP